MLNTFLLSVGDVEFWQPLWAFVLVVIVLGVIAGFALEALGNRIADRRDALHGGDDGRWL